MGLRDFFQKGEEKKIDPPQQQQPVQLPDTSPQIPEIQSQPDQEYTIVSGDSLSKIAKQFYGNANKWNTIYEANKDVIKNPDLIHPGQKIKIPKQ